jgi:hypothetical protein
MNEEEKIKDILKAFEIANISLLLKIKEREDLDKENQKNKNLLDSL